MAPLATPVVDKAGMETPLGATTFSNPSTQAETRVVRVVGPSAYYTLPDPDLMAGHGSKLVQSVALTSSFALATRELDK